jgi:hypothetical protein
MHIAELIGTKLRKSDHVGRGWDPNTHDVIIFGKRRNALMGFILGETALVVHWKDFQSWRIRRGNLGFSSSVQLLSSNRPPNKEYLAQYFDENQDNPYAVYHAICRLYRGKPMDDLTQMPPLALPNYSPDGYAESLRKLIALAKPGDLIFSRSADSSISTLIRREDKSPFSHVALYMGDGEVADTTPSGLQINRLEDSPCSTHYALYATKPGLTDEQRTQVTASMRGNVDNSRGYNYRGVLDLWLRRKLGLPSHPRRPSISDLLFKMDMELRAYV